MFLCLYLCLFLCLRLYLRLFLRLRLRLCLPLHLCPDRSAFFIFRLNSLVIGAELAIKARASTGQGINYCHRIQVKSRRLLEHASTRPDNAVPVAAARSVSVCRSSNRQTPLDNSSNNHSGSPSTCASLAATGGAGVQSAARFARRATSDRWLRSALARWRARVQVTS